MRNIQNMRENKLTHNIVEMSLKTEDGIILETNKSWREPSPAELPPEQTTRDYPDTECVRLGNSEL